MNKQQRLLNLSIAIAIGVTVSILLLAISNTNFDPKLSQFFLDNSLTKAFGKNVVNVLLVDFRAFDTLGEALVILATAIGVGLLFQRNKQQQS